MLGRILRIGRSTSIRSKVLICGILILTVVVSYFARRPDGVLRYWWLELQTTDSLSRRIQQEDVDSYLLYHYANRLVNKGSPTEATAPAGRAARSLPRSYSSSTSHSILALAGYLEARFGDDSTAATYLAQAHRFGGNGVYVHLGLGINQVRNERLDDAKREFREAARIEPANSEAWLRLGTACFADGDLDEAVSSLKRAAELAPQDAQIHADLGEVYSQLRQFSEAAMSYRAAMELAPTETKYVAKYAATRAYAARTDTEYRQAANLMERIVEGDPTNSEMRFLLAGLHFRFLDWADARREFEAGLTHSQRNAGAWFNLGTVCYWMGDSHGSQAAYAKYDELIGLESGIITAKRLIAASPKNARLHLRLSMAFRRAGANREALDELKRAAELDPNDPEIRRVAAAAAAYLQHSATAPSASKGITERAAR